MQEPRTEARTRTAPIIDLDSLPDGALLTPRETAAMLKVSPGTLANSRAKSSPSAKFRNNQAGLLFGVPAPQYVRYGRLVRYRAGDVREWLAQFETRTAAQKGAA